MRSVLAIAIVLGVAVAAITALALLLGSTGSDDTSENEIQREPLTIVTADGKIGRLQVEIAETPEERTAGLSGRTEVPQDTGMLFIIPERGAGFWMKDTSVALSVAFLARCGEILDIQDMEPLSMELHNTEGDYKFGLETPQGWFEANGISAGDLVSIPRGHRYDGC